MQILDPRPQVVINGKGLGQCETITKLVGFWSLSEKCYMQMLVWPNLGLIFFSVRQVELTPDRLSPSVK